MKGTKLLFQQKKTNQQQIHDISPLEMSEWNVQYINKSNQSKWMQNLNAIKMLSVGMQRKQLIWTKWVNMIAADQRKPNDF